MAAYKLFFLLSFTCIAAVAGNVAMHWSPNTEAAAAAGLVVEAVEAYTDSNTASGSESHTVQAGTDLLLVFVGGYYGSQPIDDMQYNSVAMTEFDVSDTSADDSQQLFYLATPATGANTLSWSGGVSMFEGAIIHAVNLSGVDTAVGTSGIRAEDSSYNSSCLQLTNSPSNNADDLLITQWLQPQSLNTTSRTYAGTSGTQTEEAATAFAGVNEATAFLTSSQPTGASQTVQFTGISCGYPGGVTVAIAKD